MFLSTVLGYWQALCDVLISLKFRQHCYDDYDAHDKREEDQWRQNAPHRPQRHQEAKTQPNDFTCQLL